MILWIGTHRSMRAYAQNHGYSNLEMRDNFVHYLEDGGLQGFDGPIDIHYSGEENFQSPRELSIQSAVVERAHFINDIFDHRLDGRPAVE